MLAKIPQHGHDAHLGVASADYETAKNAALSRLTGGTAHRVWLTVLWIFGMEEGRVVQVKRLFDPWFERCTVSNS